ncbi:hypothetical protein E1301_Tti015257 [Triplophysa tibetana]|uniref:Coiled-coil domain-containing protein n=1 Tax=Triplophysa tibetana TaxID=1572043 RepID=A0A5A9PSH8_9TELE|nr:hypothetical protein E1301_Tti015257 [Triplophysa tibetana]
MSGFASSSSKSLTSTPLKSKPSVLQRSRSVESTGDSTSSLLSPIYHDSFELSEDEPDHHHVQPANNNITATLREDVAPGEASRDESGTIERSSDAQFMLGAWEQWLVDKAREERVRKQQKALEDLALKEKQEQEKKHQLKKKVASDGKIQEWLQTKREEEKNKSISKEFQKSKEQLQEEKRREGIEIKAREKYKEWLRQKKQEEMERKLKEKEEAARREMEEQERKKQADESFKEWLEAIKTKGKASRLSSAGNYNNVNYPSPSFVNPIPWKPIHIPHHDRPPQKSLRCKKTSGRPKSLSTPCLTYRPKDTLSSACKRR